MTTEPGFQNLPELRWLGLSGPVQLTEPLEYLSPANRHRAARLFKVPAGTVSDLESRPLLLPAFINWLLEDKLSTALEALLHDDLYHRGPRLDPPVGRAEADAIYYEALRLTAQNPSLAAMREAGALRQVWLAPFAAGRGARNWLGAQISWLGLRVGGGIAWAASRAADPR